MPAASVATRRSSAASETSSPGCGQASVATATRSTLAPAASSRARNSGAGISTAWAISAASAPPVPWLVVAAHSTASRLLHVPVSPATTHSALAADASLGQPLHLGRLEVFQDRQPHLLRAVLQREGIVRQDPARRSRHCRKLFLSLDLRFGLRFFPAARHGISPGLAARRLGKRRLASLRRQAHKRRLRREFSAEFRPALAWRVCEISAPRGRSSVAESEEAPGSLTTSATTL